jgi:succinate dehydrogenase / fumarate reductase flavoprotein subunit
MIVVGGGLAGLMTTMKCAEAGHAVDLFSVVPVKRSHSVCAQGGINGAVNIKGEGDSPEIHFDDTIYGGDFLADQPHVKAMCYAAPGIIYLLDRLGVMFNRTAEGNLDFRRFGGTLHHRTAFAGATTGQQLLYALDEQVRRWEVEGLVTKYEHWELVGLVRDDEGICRGIVAVDRKNLEVKAFRGDAVILCTGGPGLIFGRSTNSMINTGSANAIAYRQGAHYANGEFIQVHPTAIPGEDKLRLMSESARGEGGRIWVPKVQGDKRNPGSIPAAERFYFLEEWYPKYGNLVPRDVASRAIHKVVYEMGLGVEGKAQVYLDVTEIPRETLDRKLKGILEIYEKFMGQDPREVPMKVFPAVHYSMGGLWVDFEKDPATGMIKVGSPRNQATNIPGLYCAGEADYAYHGANRLGANSLVSCLYAGQIAGPAMVAYAKGLQRAAADVASSVFEREEKRWRDHFEKILAMDGPENPYGLHRDLGEMMTEHVTVTRYNDKLRGVLGRLQEMKERWRRCSVLDTTRRANQTVLFVNNLWNMLELAEVITLGALQRDESRGAHWKPEFPKRDDARFLKTTIASWTPDGPKIEYIPVDTSLIPPRERKYA